MAQDDTRVAGPVFSVVMPVFNVEQYLAEAIDSVVSQSIGFQENCEIILVNDGSTDSSEEVCLDYVKKYPENIFYIKQKNAGPNSARNRGVEKARGNYISLLDSDDKLSSETFEEVLNFFESKGSDVDVVGLKWELFEAKTGDHPLNYRFTKDRIIDLSEEFDSPQMSVATAIFRKKVFDRYRFAEDVGIYAEDPHFLARVLLEKRKYGIVVKPKYYYRKRKSQSSSQDKSRTDKFWYLETPKTVWDSLIKFSIKRGEATVPKFIQFMIMYDLQWRFKQSTQDILNKQQTEKYKDTLLQLLKYIDDDVISAQRNIDANLLAYLLSQKHGKDAARNAVEKDGEFRFGDTTLYKTKWQRKTNIVSMKVKSSKMTITGFLASPLFGDEKLVCVVGDKRYSLKYAEVPGAAITFIGQVMTERSSFTVTVPHTDETTAEFKIVRKGAEDIPTKVVFAGDNHKLTHAISEEFVAYVPNIYGLLAMSRNNKYRYKFTVAIPVYNAADYIAETVQSVVNQSIGFKENCEIILIDDGSTDNSEDVCRDLVSRYPSNIRYVKQLNAGPGAARNYGALLARGKYVNLLDSDDKWSENTFGEVYRFFESHKDEIDLVSTKVKLFDAKSGDHPLNYKFTANRVIDLEVEHESVQGFTNSVFYKAEVFKKHLFHPDVGRYSEDLRFIAEVLMDKHKYGTVIEPTYYYRKRRSQTSSQDKTRRDKFWYLETPKRALLDLLEYATDSKGKIPRFVQYNVMYEITWRLKQPNQDILSGEQLEEYRHEITKILQRIDDDIIIGQKTINAELRICALSLKHGYNIIKKVKLKDGKYTFKGQVVFEADWPRKICIDLTEYEEGNATFHGFIKGPVFIGDTVTCKVGGKVIDTEPVDRYHKERKLLGAVVSDYNCFKVRVPLKSEANITFSISTAEEKNVSLAPEFERFSRMPVPIGGWSYTNLKDMYLITYNGSPELIVQNRTAVAEIFKAAKYEALLTMKFMKIAARKINHKLGSSKPRPASSGGKGAAAALEQPSEKRSRTERIIDVTLGSPISLRFIYHVTKPFIRKDVWLVSDRLSAADDNGEVFYKYLLSQPQHGRSIYFMIGKDTDDYQRLKKEGKIVSFFSLKHKILFMHASKVISSEATYYVVNPFFGRAKYFRDFADFDFVFLQHGIIRDDISDWVQKYNQNIRLFVTTAKPERESIINGNYHYTEREVVLTGQARYDNLVSTPKKKLIIIPTWRTTLAMPTIKGTDKRSYNPDFKDSEYYDFWNRIIQDDRIQSALKKHGMKGEFYLHHTLRAQFKDFQSNAQFTVMKYPYDFQQMKSEGSLLVTDFSSVALDFAYLKKPIIYAQFDVDKYYETSTSSEGYLSYEEAGLGPVAYDYESAVDEIVKAINNDCKMSPKYQERAKDFFGSFDRHNSRRIYQAILSLDQHNAVRHAVKRPPRHWINRIKNRNMSAVRTFWWRPDWAENNGKSLWLNFGDEFTAYALWSIWGLRSVWSRPKQAKLAATGSILKVALHRGKKGMHIWGSGYISDEDKEDPKGFDIRALRGPKTLQQLGIKKQNIALGDPGLLANLVFRASNVKRYKVGVVPHYVDYESSKLEGIRNNPDYLIIDVLQTPDKVALDISACEYIVSSSMHGLIFADSFGIPNNWMPLSDKLAGGEFKFQDYYQSTNRDVVKVAPSILGKESKIQRAKENYVPISNLKEIQDNLIKSFPLS